MSCERSRSFKVTDICTVWKPIYDYLLVIRCNLSFISPRFRDITALPFKVTQGHRLLLQLKAVSRAVCGPAGMSHNESSSTCCDVWQVDTLNVSLSNSSAALSDTEDRLCQLQRVIASSEYDHRVLQDRLDVTRYSFYYSCYYYYYQGDV